MRAKIRRDRLTGNIPWAILSFVANKPTGPCFFYVHTAAVVIGVFKRGMSMILGVMVARGWGTVHLR